jgi:hypothetical protein
LKLKFKKYIQERDAPNRDPCLAAHLKRGDFEELEERRRTPLTRHECH